MDFDIRQLTDKQLMECIREAKKRVDMQVGDAMNGDDRGSYSYGTQLELEIRSLDKREQHALMGCLGEKIGSILMKCFWPKEKGQYKNNKNPDLKPTFKGRVVACDARANGYQVAIYRIRDNNRPNELLFAVTNLPYGLVCQVGYGFFGDLKKLVIQHPEWKVHNRIGGEYWEIPIEFLQTDFSLFGQ